MHRALLLAALATALLAPAAHAENDITPHVCTSTGGAVVPNPAAPTGASCTGGPFNGATVHG